MISLWIASALTCSNEMHVAVYLVMSFSTGLENGESGLRCQSQALMSTPDVSSCHLEQTRMIRRAHGGTESLSQTVGDKLVKLRNAPSCSRQFRRMK